MWNLLTSSTLTHEHKALMGWIALISAVMFVGCLVIVPWLVVRLPADYFLTARRLKTSVADRHPVLRVAGLIAKNLAGFLLLLAGVVMLVFPGQGILTIAVGVLLIDFPGKRALERRIIRIPAVFKAIAWLRRKANVEPMRIDGDSESLDSPVTAACSDQSASGEHAAQTRSSSES